MAVDEGNRLRAADKTLESLILIAACGSSTARRSPRRGVTAVPVSNVVELPSVDVDADGRKLLAPADAGRANGPLHWVTAAP